jgi:hypothetical protein
MHQGSAAAALQLLTSSARLWVGTVLHMTGPPVLSSQHPPCRFAVVQVGSSCFARTLCMVAPQQLQPPCESVACQAHAHVTTLSCNSSTAALSCLSAAGFGCCWCRAGMLLRAALDHHSDCCTTFCCCCSALRCWQHPNP